ncbi:hypothetical protein CAC42_4727 [Sphaceloma murrayae]|uniref:Uncharacterized protein n=1 Tax=Sphaceloma murrayae TaxID=2082308 RepID=A0A2K1QPG2_9PEZI|nr:hypothetical protein CAC42_4727 [Sphaceloma murrayae]
MRSLSLESLTVSLAGLAAVSAASPPKSYRAAPVPEGNTYYGGHSFAELAKTKYWNSPHFRIYNTTKAKAAGAIQHLEGAFDCFVNVLGWKDPGISMYSTPDQGPYYKVNVFTSDPLPGVLGYMTGDYKTGLAYEVMLDEYVNRSSVVVHEFGHVLTFANTKWWNQTSTSSWAETIANYVGETYNTSPLCAASRQKFNDTGGWTLFQPQVVVSYSYLTLIDATQAGNDYFAWPFLAYMTTNLDNYAGLGRDIMKKMFNRYKVNSNETPFHTLQRILGQKATVQQVVKNYWARMANADFNNTMMYTQLFYYNSQLNYDNLYANGTNTYRVKTAKQPKYFGASIIPLNVTSSDRSATVRITAPSAFSATVAVKDTSASGFSVRYIDVAITKNAGRATFKLGENEQATLTVVNTPKELLQYDGRVTNTGAVAEGLDFRITMKGAVPPYSTS